jgi:hypothetical protein
MRVKSCNDFLEKAFDLKYSYKGIITILKRAEHLALLAA